MHSYFSFKSRDDEKRYLRLDVDRWKRAAQIHKKKREEAERQVKEWERRNKELEKQIEKLKQEQEEIKRQRDTYKNMLFKKNISSPSLSESTLLDELTPKKKRGGQIGHIGYGRSCPRDVNSCKRIYAKTCPDCNRKLKRAKSTLTHTVEDIPLPQVVKPIVTSYSIERQWCNNCKKEVTAKPVEVIPASRLGINLVTHIMLLKYGAKIPLDAVVLLLENQYGIKISKGGIIQILQRTKKWLGRDYEVIKQKIRASPVIHADETGWRIEGLNAWVWAFLSKDNVCYQIEESRGKGVPQGFLKDGNPHAVLVRDDYAAYKKIPLTQQSCWAHMLRKSHEAVEQPEVSKEMRKLHKKLKVIYETLEEKTKKPFDLYERRKAYDLLLKDIRTIIDFPYRFDDALRIQTRIKNQNKNLLTALLYPNIPLTNNHAERNIRPLVITRKISGGSRSAEGAKTHMVNMSVFQTIRLKNLPLISTLKSQLLNGAFGKN